MDKLPFIDATDWMDDHCDDVVTYYTYRNLVTVGSIQADVFSHLNTHLFTELYPDGYSKPVRMNQFFVMLVYRGMIRVSLDYVSYIVSAHHQLQVIPGHIIRIAEASQDFEAKVLMLNNTYLAECLINKCISLSMPDYMQLRKEPCLRFTPEEMACMERYFLQLEEKINLSSHAFHEEVIQNSIVAFFLELANIVVTKMNVYNRPAFSRKEEVLNRFLQLLLEHVDTDRSVAFYAEKLCVTTQYLTLVTNRLTGQPANKWIENAFIAEAKMQLKAPHLSIQQVADGLHFPDQATFGKYFKKCTGLSPAEYRRSQACTEGFNNFVF
ncbi:MAG: AraC family transcriptional regulator [Tannerellaceae bacterium]|jgi:AraC-like DNA-binding protein|nr:AraC family transcriptional regulator [Tannerellaceae bacterium]